MTEECILEGWSRKDKTQINFYKYPCCGRLTDSISYGSDKLVKCYNCNVSSHIDKFNETVSRMKPSCVCKICGTEITLTSNNKLIGSFDGYMCFKCNNIVAIEFKRYIIQPQTALRLSWNSSVNDRSEKMNENLNVVQVATEKDFFVLRTLNFIARHEYTCFTAIREEDKKACIFIDEIRNKYVGYVLWTDDEYQNVRISTMRQLFLIREEQKKGYGTSIVKWWVENVSDKINDKFIVESPNKLSQKILNKLGYAKFTENGISGIKCGFTG
jgi:hypothetical protein